MREGKDFYNETIFLTGGSGFLGSVLACQILSHTSCLKLVLLCRGGEDRLFGQWKKILPSDLFSKVTSDPRIQVVSGDICQTNLDLDIITSQTLQSEVSVVVHAASSISLGASLQRISQTVVQGTLNVAHFALRCRNLARFIHISTAYVNAHLYSTGERRLYEQIYPLEPCENMVGSALLEWDQIQKDGTTEQYETAPFPWPYAYAKHLTERLLIDLFSSTSHLSEKSAVTDNSFPDRLLIVRPSIIGPSQSFPSAGWQVARSAPISSCIAVLVLSPSFRLKFRSDIDDPDTHANLDEVPVDIVVNTILAHASAQSSGIVHAVCGRDRCYTVGDYTSALQRLRRLPWFPKFVWKAESIQSDNVCQLARIFRVIGTRYDFDNQRTVDLVSQDSQKETLALPLLVSSERGPGMYLNVEERRRGLEQNMAFFLRKRGLPKWLLPVMYRRGVIDETPGKA